MLFIIYLLYLIWAILFKFSFSYEAIPYKRQTINLKVFLDPAIYSPPVIREKILNILIFVPFGAYLYILGCRKIPVGILIMFLTSFLFETAQYVFILGTSDLADLLTNTAGGTVGLLLAYLTFKASGREEKLTKHFAVLALAVSIMIISGTFILKMV